MPPQLSVTAGALLEPFNGRWRLDLRRSDAITPMLEALGTPYLIRKVAANLQVEQTIRITGAEFEIQNETSYGTSFVVHLINGGPVELTDDKGEKTLDETVLDEEAPFPVVICAELPKNKGFTKDSRRILTEEDQMEQVLEYRSKREDQPITMKRFWTRVSSNNQMKPTSNPEATLSRIPGKEYVADSQTVQPKQNPVPIVPPAQMLSEPSMTREDWPTIILVMIFFTSCWFREDYFQAFVWFGLVILLRTKAIFPITLLSKNSPFEWWSHSSAKFSATALTMVYATQVILNPLEDSNLTMGLEALAVVSSYCWTRRYDLAELDFVNAFKNDRTTSQSRAWADLAVIGLVISASTERSMNLSAIVFASMLYLSARYRVYIVSESTPPRPAQAMKASPAKDLSPPKPNQQGMSLQITSSRVARYVRRPFAQYLVEIHPGSSSKHHLKGPFSVWCRYRDLHACYDAIARLYSSKHWRDLPSFPPKQWDSTSEATVTSRQMGLDQFFQRVFSDHGEDIAKLDIVQRVFQLDETRIGVLQEVHDATRKLFLAKRMCETAVGEGEDSSSGWVVINSAHREYMKVFPDGRKAFKRIAVVVGNANDEFKRVTTQRSTWDRACLTEAMVRKMSISQDDEARAFSGMVLHPEQAFVPVKHVTRATVSLFSAKPTSLLVFQAVLHEPLTGRRAFIETSVGDSVDDVLKDNEQEIIVYSNGFIFDPFAGNRTKITCVRSEFGCNSSFVIPV